MKSKFVKVVALIAMVVGFSGCATGIRHDAVYVGENVMTFTMPEDGFIITKEPDGKVFTYGYKKGETKNFGSSGVTTGTKTYFLPASELL